METASLNLLRFENYTLDLARCTLLRGEQEIQLRPKAFDALRYLAERPGRVVTKDELHKAIWPSIVVTDDSLVQCVKFIRDALGDDADRIIKTVPRRGYLFAAEVSAPSANAAVRPMPSGTNGASRRSGVRWSPHKRKLSFAFAGALAVFLGVGLWLVLERSNSPEAATGAIGGASNLAGLSKPSIGVLPLKNRSGDPGQDYFSDGVTEDIINSLSRFSGLLVIARSSSFSFKEKSVSASEAAQQLGVRYILEGSIQKSAEHVRVNIQLVDATTGTNRWTDRFDRPVADIFVMQDEIAQRVVSTLIAHISRAEIERAVRKGVPDLGAYDYFLRGRALRLRYKQAEMEEAVQILEQAVTLDPSFAPAHVELGHAYRIKSNQRWSSEPAKDLNQASDLAQRAITLDPALAEAHALLGSVYVLQGRFEEALAANERAIALNPNDADSYARLAVALTRAGHPKQAIDNIRDAIRLDPFYPPIYLAYLGRAHYLAREYDKAVPVLKRCAERVPELSTCRGWLAASYAQLSRNVSAREELAHWRRLRPGVTAQQYRRDQAQGYAKSADFDHVMEGLKKAGLADSGD